MNAGRDWIVEQSEITLERLLPRIVPLVEAVPDHPIFLERLRANFPDAFEMFLRLYGSQYDCHYHLEQTLTVVASAFSERSDELKKLDSEREQNPTWFQSENMVGAVCYVDLFAGNLEGLRQRLPYLKELGITYLHLMPLFAVPEPHNDGGYAVSSFRIVNPRIGTMQELESLTGEFRKHGISLVLDFVFNHTSDEHEWAQRALAGDKTFQSYFRMFDDRATPDAYEPYLREIFPDQAPGSFTFRPEIGKWVWTTFNTFQWDLNYANPEVFRAMLGEILFLANRGADVLRLDAVPFIWKELGTSCENLPAAHWIIRGFNAFVRIACPSLLFKSEAIVHPRDVQSYIDAKECQLSYNPILMSHLWDALATRETFLMRRTMEHRFALPDRCSWLNYIRSHDDIGWGFANEDAAEVGINGADHRYFLNSFYVGRFPGSFAMGVPFNYNPRTQDMRISGTAASLAGLERALETGDVHAIESAIQRIVLLYGIILSVGGIPLIYLGDELGTLNDYDYLQDPAKAEDSRWVHRPPFKESRYAHRHDSRTPEGRIFESIIKLIQIRKTTPELSGSAARFFDLNNKHIFAYTRSEAITVLANFSEYPQFVSQASLLREINFAASTLQDLITKKETVVTEGLELKPYEVLWLKQKTR